MNLLAEKETVSNWPKDLSFFPAPSPIRCTSREILPLQEGISSNWPSGRKAKASLGYGELPSAGVPSN